MDNEEVDQIIFQRNCESVVSQLNGAFLIKSVLFINIYIFYYSDPGLSTLFCLVSTSPDGDEG